MAESERARRERKKQISGRGRGFLSIDESLDDALDNAKSSESSNLTKKIDKKTFSFPFFFRIQGK